MKQHPEADESLTVVCGAVLYCAVCRALQICEEARIAVASALPPELVGSDSVTDSM
jgi:hypothetical protein